MHLINIDVGILACWWACSYTSQKLYRLSQPHCACVCMLADGGKEASGAAASATSMTPNRVYPIIYICCLGRSICRHLTKKKKILTGVQSFPQRHFSTSVFTAQLIKPSSTVQYTESFCSCSVPHISLNVALHSEPNHCMWFLKHTCKLF